MKNWLFSLFLVPVALLIPGCKPNSSAVRLIVADAYKGPIRIKQAPDGVPIKKYGDAWVFEIPATGTLLAQSTAPLKLIRIPGEAVYKSGNLIPWALPDIIEGSGANDRTMLRQLGTDSDGWYYFFVGTSNEAKKYWGKINGASIP